jgi:hypothetical protein
VKMDSVQTINLCGLKNTILEIQPIIETVFPNVHVAQSGTAYFDIYNKTGEMQEMQIKETMNLNKTYDVQFGGK